MCYCNVPRRMWVWVCVYLSDACAAGQEHRAGGLGGGGTGLNSTSDAPQLPTEWAHVDVRGHTCGVFFCWSGKYVCSGVIEERPQKSLFRRRVSLSALSLSHTLIFLKTRLIHRRLFDLLSPAAFVSFDVALGGNPWNAAIAMLFQKTNI